MESVTFTFHDNSVQPVLQLFANAVDATYHFGKLDIKVVDNVPLIAAEQYIHFTVDCSGSMDDYCSDKRTKLDYLKFTLKNMLHWLVTNPVNVLIAIDAFDSKIHPIVPTSKLTKDNIESIIDAVNQIRPDSLTNIELALKTVKARLLETSILNPGLTINEIFLTDGEATEGEAKSEALATLIDSNYKYTFVGFGDNHDDEMLTVLANGIKNSYRFIDAIEKSSLVYGEILSNIFNLVFDQVTINLEGGEIYDFRTNKWVPTLCVGGIVCEETKTFHVRTQENPDLIKAELIGLDIHNEPTNPSKLISTNTNATITYADINTYIFRQRVQELLYEAKEKTNKPEHNLFRFISFEEDEMAPLFNNNNDNNNDTNNTNNNNKKSLKVQLKELQDQIKEYMATNNLQDDKLLKLLCDDLYVAYKSYGNRRNNKYIAARHMSQGTQQLYTVSLTNGNNNNNNNLNYRQKSARFEDLNEEDNNDDNYQYSTAKDSPFKTPKRARIMRDVSHGMSSAEDDI